MGYLDEVLQRAKTARNSTSDQALALGKEFASNRAQLADPKPVAKAPAANNPMPPINPKANYGDRPGEMRIDTRGMTRPLGSFKKGTDYVPKTGVYKLHEGEKVVPAKENKMDAKAAMQDITGGKKAKPAKKIKEIRTRKTDDGKFVHTHLHHNPEHHQDEMHVSNDLKEAQQHLSDHEGSMSPQAPPPDEAAGGEGTAAPSGM